MFHRFLVMSVLFCAMQYAFAQTLPYAESFSTGSAGWSVVDDTPAAGGPGVWKAAGGVLTQASNVYTTANEYANFTGTHIWAGGKKWADYSFNALVRSTDDDGIGILFRYQDPLNYYRFIMVQDVNNKGPFQLLQKRVNGTFTTLKPWYPKTAIPAGWFSLTADVRGDKITVYVNGEEWGSVTDTQFSEGAIGFMCYANDGAAFDSVRVDEARTVYAKPEAAPSERYPNLLGASETGMTIAWRSGTRSAGRVDYGTTPALGRSWTDTAATFQHAAVLEGLEPSTRYYYKVFNDGNAKTDVLSFSTIRPAGADSVSFIVWGDSGVNTPTQYAVAALMEKETVDFGIHVGDVSQSNGSEYDIIYYTPYKNILSKIPTYPCIGNHDTYFDNAGTYLREFDLPHNNPLSTERYYSYRIGSVYAISMDTNIDFSPTSEQYRWLEGILAGAERKQSRWTIVYFHHPPYCEAWPGWAGDANVRAHLVPLLERYGVDIVFNGHTHAYEHGILGRVHYVITGGGGGGLDAIARNVPQILVSKSEHHYTRVRTAGGVMTVVARNTAGAVIDSFAVVKTTASAIGLKSATAEAAYGLQQNYPNPFNPSTRISYTVPSESLVRMRVFDVIGRQIAELYNGLRQAGSYEAQWHADAPGGVYFYRIDAAPVSGGAAAFHAVRSMLLVK